MGASASVINNLTADTADEFIEKLLEKNPKFRPDVPNYKSWSLEDKKKTIKLMVQASGMYKEGGKRSSKHNHSNRKSKKNKTRM
jgi:hypothetical protein